MKWALKAELVFGEQKDGVNLYATLARDVADALTLSGDELSITAEQLDEVGSALQYRVRAGLRYNTQANRDKALQAARVAKEKRKLRVSGRIEAHVCRHDDNMACVPPTYLEEWDANP